MQVKDICYADAYDSGERLHGSFRGLLEIEVIIL